MNQYHGSQSGAEERRRFEDLFSKKTIVSDLPQVEAQRDAEGKVNLISLIVDQGFAKSRSEARRLLQQKAVKVDGKSIEVESISTQKGQEFVLRVGKLHMIKVLTVL